MKLSDTLLGLILAGFGGVVIYLTLGFPKMPQGFIGPSLFPRVIACLFVLCGIILFLQGVRRKQPLISTGRQLNMSQVTNVLMMAAAVFFYIYASGFLGFILTSFIILSILMVKFGVKPVVSGTVSVLVTLSIYLLFRKFLLVPLPLGLIYW